MKRLAISRARFPRQYAHPAGHILGLIEDFCAEMPAFQSIGRFSIEYVNL
jgi:hypothetical protein